jgi:hypothetical protein
MTVDTDTTGRNGNGAADAAERSGLWTRVEGVRDAVAERTRTAADYAGRRLSSAQQRAVTTVREKPVTVSLATAGLALLAAGAVFALRNPQLVRAAADFARRNLRRR